ncbi:hypothetical protein CAC42_2298 [Sphaceloma murrayae]|uniref:Uncharacterized protein n=1 Tax=Sphaceloma murrayae TaxID=2082308 RepID=A0A2K1QJK2_9PEZI|nr:hypothetical protein CAC42_2298 [Sphaceloma murrayae]
MPSLAPHSVTGSQLASKEDIALFNLKLDNLSLALEKLAAKDECAAAKGGIGTPVATLTSVSTICKDNKDEQVSLNEAESKSSVVSHGSVDPTMMTPSTTRTSASSYSNEPTANESRDNIVLSTSDLAKILHEAIYPIRDEDMTVAGLENIIQKHRKGTAEYKVDHVETRSNSLSPARVAKAKADLIEMGNALIAIGGCRGHVTDFEFTQNMISDFMKKHFGDSGTVDIKETDRFTGGGGRLVEAAESVVRHLGDASEELIDLAHRPGLSFSAHWSLRRMSVQCSEMIEDLEHIAELHVEDEEKKKKKQGDYY